MPKKSRLKLYGKLWAPYFLGDLGGLNMEDTGVKQDISQQTQHSANDVSPTALTIFCSENKGF